MRGYTNIWGGAQAQIMLGTCPREGRAKFPRAVIPDDRGITPGEILELKSP